MSAPVLADTEQHRPEPDAPPCVMSLAAAVLVLPPADKGWALHIWSGESDRETMRHWLLQHGWRRDGDDSGRHEFWVSWGGRYLVGFMPGGTKLRFSVSHSDHQKVAIVARATAAVLAVWRANR